MRPRRRRPCLVVIGGGTGAASVLYRILEELPGRLPASIVVGMHLPSGFSHALATRIDARSDLPVKPAKQGSVLAPGTVWVGPDDARMRVMARGDLFVVGLDQAGEATPTRPSIDRLFRSAAERLGPRVVGVVLSGSGRDGVEGAGALHAAGAEVLVQDPWSATAWSLPGAVVRQGAASEIVTPQRLAAEIVRRLGGLHTGEWTAA